MVEITFGELYKCSIQSAAFLKSKVPIHGLFVEIEKHNTWKPLIFNLNMII